MKNGVLILIVIAAVGISTYSYYEYQKKYESDELSAEEEAYENSPECSDMPFRNSKDPVHIEKERIYTQEKLDAGSEKAKKCWEAIARYMREHGNDI